MLVKGRGGPGSDRRKLRRLRLRGSPCLVTLCKIYRERKNEGAGKRELPVLWFLVNMGATSPRRAVCHPSTLAEADFQSQEKLD